MTSYFMLLQFVPNQVAKERINVGVVTFSSSGTIYLAITNNWHFVRTFSGKPIGHFKEFLFATVEDFFSWPDSKVVENMFLWAESSSQSSMLQFTEPLPSTFSAKTLLKKITKEIPIRMKPRIRSNKKITKRTTP